MSLKKRSANIFICATICLNASAGEMIHIVSKGESLSRILYKRSLIPIYGKKGSLSEALALNPEIKKRKDYKIFPGEKIKLVSRDVVAEVPLEKNDSDVVAFESVTHPISIDNETIKTTEESVQKRLPSDSLGQKSYWHASAILSWKNLETTETLTLKNSNIDALSSMSYGVSGLYGFQFSRDLKIFSTLSFDYSLFNEDNTINLTKKKILLNKFDFGANFLSDYTLKAGFMDLPYLTSPSLSTVEIKKISVPNLDFNFQKKFWELGQTSLEAGAGIKTLLPTSGALKTDLSLGYGAQMTFKFKNQSFLVGYDFTPLKSKTNDTNIQNIYWNFKLEDWE